METSPIGVARLVPDVSTSAAKSWLQDAQIHRDRNMRLEYLAGLALNNSMQDDIFRAMLQYRRYPQALFVASNKVGQSLEEALRPPE